MRTPQPATTLEDQPIPVRAKLAAAWTSFMFLYAYVDILNFFTPGVVEDILDGRVFEFALSQAFSTTALTLMAVPIFMVVLSMTLLYQGEPHREPHRGCALPSRHGVQRSGSVLALLLRPRHRPGNDPSRPHPAARLDLALHRTFGDHGRP